MMKILKWLAIACMGVLGVLLAVGLLLPDQSAPSRQAQQGGVSPPPNTTAQSASAISPLHKVNYAPDQCLDGICIGMTAGELVDKSWRKKEVIGAGDVSSQQRELLEADLKGHAELCASRQTAWEGKTTEMCNLLSRSISNPRSYGYRTLQVAAVVDYFANQKKPVCEFYKEERAYVNGDVPTESGETKVKLRFDANGMLRVFEISKGYQDQNAETNAAIAIKLMEKHPYVTKPSLNAWGDPISRDGDKTGEAPWGGTVRVVEEAGKAPMIWMKAKLADFDQSNLAVCKQAKTISVQ